MIHRVPEGKGRSRDAHVFAKNKLRMGPRRLRSQNRHAGERGRVSGGHCQKAERSKALKDLREME
jgi:hypothetical protein